MKSKYTSCKIEIPSERRPIDYLIAGKKNYVRMKHIRKTEKHTKMPPIDQNEIWNSATINSDIENGS